MDRGQPCILWSLCASAFSCERVACLFFFVHALNVLSQRACDQVLVPEPALKFGSGHEATAGDGLIVRLKPLTPLAPWRSPHVPEPLLWPGVKSSSPSAGPV